MMHKTPPTIELYKLGPVVSLVSGVDDLSGEILREIENLLDDFDHLEKADLRAFQDRIYALDLEARKAFIALSRIYAR
jgi:gamma-glutamylcyclotransferase (GGCT)/AIG2-like uncharacterized protein YtfP